MAESLQLLLDQKERDLELAAQYGTALLEENKQLKEKMKELKEKLAGMEMEGSYEMKEQIQLLEESNKLMKSKLSILESKNGDLEAKIILKNAQKEDLAQTIDELTRKHKNAEDRIAMLQKELENNSTAGTIYDLNEQLEMQKEVIQDLRAKLADTQRVNTELTKKLDDATKKIDKLNSTQVSNEIDPAIIEELKELRQATAQFKREIKEKDEIIAELQTRPAEARPTVYQRTIVEVPSYVPVPGNSDATHEEHLNGSEHSINSHSDITVSKNEIATDTQTRSDTLTPMTAAVTSGNINHKSNDSSDDSTRDVFNMTYKVKSEEEYGSDDSTRDVFNTTYKPKREEEGESGDRSRNVFNTTYKAKSEEEGGSDDSTREVFNTTYKPKSEEEGRSDDSTRDVFNTTYKAKSEEEGSTRSEVATNGHVKSEPVAIQQAAQNNQSEPKKTEKTPPSSPRAIYRDPRFQDLASKLTEAERLLSIKSDEVQRLSLKLAELAERASIAPQTTIINQVVPPKKEGFLVKQGARVKNWKKRFFFIESDFLYYAESPKSRFVTLGMIRLDGSEVDQAIIPNRAHVIAVKTSDRTYYLCADTEEDMHEWLKVLKEKVEDIAEKKRNEK